MDDKLWRTVLIWNCVILYDWCDLYADSFSIKCSKLALENSARTFGQSMNDIVSVYKILHTLYNIYNTFPLKAVIGVSYFFIGKESRAKIAFKSTVSRFSDSKLTKKSSNSSLDRRSWPLWVSNSRRDWTSLSGSSSVFKKLLKN